MMAFFRESVKVLCLDTLQHNVLSFIVFLTSCTRYTFL